jgi:hypothetical protein
MQAQSQGTDPITNSIGMKLVLVPAGKFTMWHGEEIPFTDIPGSILETKKAISWLRQALLAAGKGIPSFFGHNFGLTLFEVALAFQEPRLIRSAEAAGV